MEENLNNENGTNITDQNRWQEENIFIKKDQENSDTCENTPKKCNHTHSFCQCGTWILMGILLIAVVALFILHFWGSNKSDATEAFVPTPCSNKPGTGEVLYIDVDSINANYLLMEQLKAELEAEQNKQQAAFSARQSAFQKKYAQFQKNYQAGILTEAQVQNTNSQLEAESQKLEADYQQAIEDLSNRQYEANNRMLDSVKNVAARINQKRNASYILTYQKDVPFMIYKDPTKDITEEVLFELNKPFKNKENN